VITGTQLGASGQTICNLQPTSSNSTKSCAAYADFNTTITFPTNPTGQGTGSQWLGKAATTFTDMNGGNIRNVNYYKQYQITITTLGIGSGTSTTVASLGASNYLQSQVPATQWVNASATVTYSFTNLVVVNASAKYVWSSASGCSQSAISGTITASSACTLTGVFGIQYLLTINLGGHGVSAPLSGNYYQNGTVVQVTVQGGLDDTGSIRFVYNGTTGSGSGSYTGSSNPFSVTMNAPVVETFSWKTQFFVRVTASGIGGDDAAAVVTLNSVDYKLSQLPYSTWLDAGTFITYSYHSPVTLSGNQFVWSSTSGSSQSLQSNTFALSGSDTLIGTYTIPSSGGGGYYVSTITSILQSSSVTDQGFTLPNLPTNYTSPSWQDWLNNTFHFTLPTLPGLPHLPSLPHLPTFPTLPSDWGLQHWQDWFSTKMWPWMNTTFGVQTWVSANPILAIVIGIILLALVWWWLKSVKWLLALLFIIIVAIILFKSLG